MMTIDKYLRPATLEEAYAAAQKKNSVILGGMLWLRLGNRRIGTAIDLAGLVPDTVDTTGGMIRIGAYTTLRTLETHAGLNGLADNVFRDAVRSIVGVQFRNLATIGGSIFGRFGFSDVMTVFLALDASAELYKTGTVTLEDFCGMGRVNDILTHVILPDEPVTASYTAQRNTATDFPVLNTCAALRGNRLTVTVGARPLGAVPYRYALDSGLSAEAVAEEIAGRTVFASNTRASEEYRRHLCRVLVRRTVADVLKRSAEKTVKEEN